MAGLTILKSVSPFAVGVKVILKRWVGESMINSILIVILLCSLIVSTYLCHLMPRKWSRAKLVVFSFLLNTVILGSAFLILYKIDAFNFLKNVQGLFGSLGIIVLLIFIPIITWMNMIAIQLRNYEMKRADISR